MGRYKKAVAVCIFIKLVGTISELLLPYILEYIIDDLASLGVPGRLLRSADVCRRPGVPPAQRRR